MSYLALPIELLIRIFSFLNLQDLLRLDVVDKLHHDLIRHTPMLLYRTRLLELGLRDESSHHNILEKLRLLDRRSNSLKDIDALHQIRVKVAHRPSNIYDLSSGVYILGDSLNAHTPRTTKALRCLDLASVAAGPSIHDHVWPHFTMGASIVDIGLALQEHNLLAAITRQSIQHLNPLTGDVRFDDLLYLQLREFSSGHFHPRATNPSILLDRRLNHWETISIMIEVVGDFLLLNLSVNASGVQDLLYFFNWKTGKLIVREATPNKTWSGFVFLSPEAVVVPNLRLGALEIIHLPVHEDPPEGNPFTSFDRIRLLGLPALHRGHYYHVISCRADPNPLGRNSDSYQSTKPSSDSRQKKLQRPFAADPSLAIVLFQCYMGPAFVLDIRSFFSFVIHRSQLLRLAYMHNYGYSGPAPSPEEPQGDTQSDDSSESSEEDESPAPVPDLGLNLAAPPLIVQEMEIDEMDEDQVFLLEDRAATLALRASSKEIVPWEVWGPDYVRWGSSEDDTSRWITTSAGQRQVVMRDQKIIIRDFNPYAVKRMAEVIKRDPEGHQCVRVITEPTVVESNDYFANNISTSLPYVEYESASLYNYDGILMDEDFILGIVTNNVTDSVDWLELFCL